MFDYGSTNTFVSTKFAVELFVKLEKLNFQLRVSTPIKSMMCTKDVLRSYKLEIASKILFVDLIVLVMHDFDVIFGIDWMSMCGAQFYCKEKKILLVWEGKG